MRALDASLTALALASLMLGIPRESRACAACGCGDPTLTAFGLEKPFANRLRVSLDLRHRTDGIGQPNVDRIEIAESRLETQVAWSPYERLSLMLAVPLLFRSVSYVNDAEVHLKALGDIELRSKWFIAQDSAFAPRHLLAVLAGMKLPTGARQKGPDGAYLPVEAQSGTGSWDPILGLSYAYFPRPWSLYVSTQGSVPLRDTSPFRASPTLRTGITVQRQFSLSFAARLGLDTRLDGKSFEDGRPERDSGGFIGFISPELLVSPLDDLLLVLSVRTPVLQALSGYHREGIVWGAAVAYDL